MSDFEPEFVREGRDRLLAGERLPDDVRQTRPYFCRGCGARTESIAVPRGWYSVTRHTGIVETRSQRLGLFCSLRCLLAQAERMLGIEANLGDAFDRAPSEFRQRRTW